MRIVNPPAIAAVSVVQKLTKNRAVAVGSKTSAGTDWTSNVTAGNSLIVVAWCYNNASTLRTITGVSDSSTNSWSATPDIEKNVAVGVDRYDVAIYHAHNVAGGVKPTITVTASGTAANITFGCVEVSGLQNAAIDTSNSNSLTTNTTTPTTGSVTGTTADALTVIGIISGAAGVGGTVSFTEPTSYTSQIQETDNATWQAGDGATLVWTAAPSGHNPQWTTSTGPYASVIAVFKGTTAGVAFPFRPTFTPNNPILAM